MKSGTLGTMIKICHKQLKIILPTFKFNGKQVDELSDNKNVTLYASFCKDE
ncbi:MULTISPECIES: hypothetical protein [Methanosarcina]|uniref:hypothetical protein n=1 Tax=Methanosarcina TaxID=2207 RepID=UPI0012F699C6|nr:MULTISPECIES: hypothetical protein [Methanosarcina]